MNIDISIKSTEDGKIRVLESIGRCGGGSVFNSLPEAIFSLIHTYEDERIRLLLPKKENAA